MTTALIGYTGFVGSNIASQYVFDEFYNTKNIDDIKGKKFDLVVCAGVKAIKWYANQNPEEDLRGIEVLIEVLKTIETKRFVLISTIDIYPELSGYDEDYQDFHKQKQAYGANRSLLEEFTKKQFVTSHIIRLPGLFGNGIKKNIIYDLLHDNQLENIDRGASIQYYPLDRIWSDIELTLSHEISVVNFFTAPVLSSEIIDTFFPEKNPHITNVRTEAIRYDLRTKYDHIYGGENGYLISHDAIIEYLRVFIKREKEHIYSHV